MSDNQFLRSQLKITSKTSVPYQEMEDCEYVLRFLALEDHYRTGDTKFTGSFRDSMDSFMEARVKIKVAEVQRLKRVFERAIEGCEAIWGTHAFRRYNASGWRDQMLAGVYDAQMLAVSAASDTALRKSAKKHSTIVEATESLFLNDAEFESAVRVGTNTPSKLELRVSRVGALLG